MSDEKKQPEKKLGEMLAEVFKETFAANERHEAAEAKKEFEAWLPKSEEAITLFCTTTLMQVARTPARHYDFQIGFLVGKLGLKSSRMWSQVVPLLQKHALSVTALYDDYVRISF